MALVIGPVLAVTAVALVAYPSKRDPLYPERKRRDWCPGGGAPPQRWLIGGLFVGGVASHKLFIALVQLIPPVRTLSSGPTPAVGGRAAAVHQHPDPAARAHAAASRVPNERSVRCAPNWGCWWSCCGR